ncbi:DUF4442 domain-containing protein [Olivibacter sitiensis]|uniref:DUF4442 domain-containing protein n=1 Tax=Olivibacter sitiensis TaxID=376470 RepID=UPI0004020943|nr:DUF4442 domain-containing protein [Olivibacter sitiensis]
MNLSENSLKWVMRLYPPLFFQRIWTKKVHKDFLGVDVKINHSLWNKNYNGSIFGGTIFAASDPFYALLFDQIFRKKGYKTRVWLKSAEINYLKPGRHYLHYTITISPELIGEVQQALDHQGKFTKKLPISIFDKNGLLCAEVQNEVYVRNLLYQGERQSISY